MRRESAHYLQGVYEAIWRQVGASEDEARIFARCFARADVLGKDTQGIAAIPLVFPWVGSGAIRFGVPITVVKEGPAFAVVDGERGPGQIVGTKAMEIAIRKAREATVGSVWVRNSNDFTMATNFSIMALEHDYVGVAMSNGVPLVAPWGGRDQVFNTNPLSFVVPAGEEKPIIFDGSMSSVSHGHAILAARDRVRLPKDSMVDEAGHVTDDSIPIIVDAYERGSPQRGAIMPLGPKGFGWLIWVDVLAGIMSGMSAAKDITVHPSTDNPWTGGFFLMAINVGNLLSIDEFKTNVDDFIRNIKSGRLAEGFSEIVLPGERAMREAERRLREGVPIRPEDWRKLSAIASEVGIDMEALRVSVDEKMSTQQVQEEYMSWLR